MVPEEKKCCPDCGAELEEGIDTCPKCGCPIENIIETEKTPQQVEVTGVKITKKSKKIIVIAAIAVIVAAIITAIGVQTHKKNVAAKAAAEAQKQSEEYGTNLNMAAYSMPVSYTHLDVYKRQVLVGASKPEQILDNLKVLESAPFTDEELKKIDALSLVHAK